MKLSAVTACIFIWGCLLCVGACKKNGSSQTSPGGTTTPPVSTTVPTALINITGTKQQVIMMGGDMERSANAVQNATNTQQIIQWAFADIPFNICRMQYDKNQEITEGVKNFAFYNGTVQSMKDIKAVNPSIKFFATMRSDYDGFNQGDTNNLPTWIYNRQTQILNVPKYGKFLADYVEYMSQQGVPVRYISSAKEWTGVVKPDSAVKVIAIMKAELQQRSIAVPEIIDPAAWGIGQGINYISRIIQLGQTAQVAGWCTHNYNPDETKTYAEYNTAVLSTGKPWYQDETSAGGSGRFTPAGINPPIENTIDAYKEKVSIYNAGAAGEVFFELWSRGVNAESRSIYFTNNGTGERRRAYYIMKEFASGAVDAWYIPVSFLNSNNVSGMAFKKGNQLMVVLLNEGSNAIGEFKLSFSNGTVKTAGKVQWTNTFADTGEKISLLTAEQGKALTTAIAAKSITIFNISLL